MTDRKVIRKPYEPAEELLLQKYQLYSEKKQQSEQVSGDGNESLRESRRHLDDGHAHSSKDGETRATPKRPLPVPRKEVKEKEKVENDGQVPQDNVPNESDTPKKIRRTSLNTSALTTHASPLLDGQSLSKSSINESTEKENASNTDHQITDPAQCSVYIGGLRAPVSDEHFHEAFGHCGKIKDIRRVTGKNFAFMCFATRDEASKAVATMNNKEVWGMQLRVAFSRTATNAPRPGPQDTSYYGRRNSFTGRSGDVAERTPMPVSSPHPSLYPPETPNPSILDTSPSIKAASLLGIALHSSPSPKIPANQLQTPLLPMTPLPPAAVQVVDSTPQQGNETQPTAGKEGRSLVWEDEPTNEASKHEVVEEKAEKHTRQLIVYDDFM